MKHHETYSLLYLVHNLVVVLFIDQHIYGQAEDLASKHAQSVKECFLLPVWDVLYLSSAMYICCVLLIINNVIL